MTEHDRAFLYALVGVLIATISASVAVITGNEDNVKLFAEAAQKLQDRVEQMVLDP